jgi:hypothetical protein
LRTVPALLAKSRAWEEYCDSERPLEPAIRKLGSKGEARVTSTKRKPSRRDHDRAHVT